MGLFRKFARANSMATLPPIEWPFKKKKGGGGGVQIFAKSQAPSHIHHIRNVESNFFF